MSNKQLYRSLLSDKVGEILHQINAEDKKKEEQRTHKMIENLVIARRKQPSIEDARVYIEILKQEYPLFMDMSDWHIARLLLSELDVRMEPRLVALSLNRIPYSLYKTITYMR